MKQVNGACVDKNHFSHDKNGLYNDEEEINKEWNQMDKVIQNMLQLVNVYVDVKILKVGK